MQLATQSTFSSLGTPRGNPPDLPTNRSESDVHSNSLAGPLNLGNRPFRGCAGSRRARTPDHSSRMGLRIRLRTISIEATRGNRHNRPGGDGPPKADRAGDRERSHQALSPLSPDTASTSTGPQCSTAIARYSGRSYQSENGSRPADLIEKRERASAMVLPQSAMWSAAMVHSKPISCSVISRANLVNRLGSPAP